MKNKTQLDGMPVWFDGKSINEALFCEEFLQTHKIIFTNGAFFTPEGRVTDELPLRGEIFEELKCCAVSNIPRKISNIVELMKLAALAEDFPPELREKAGSVEMLTGKHIAAADYAVTVFRRFEELFFDEKFPENQERILGGSVLPGTGSGGSRIVGLLPCHRSGYRRRRPSSGSGRGRSSSCIEQRGDQYPFFVKKSYKN